MAGGEIRVKLGPPRFEPSLRQRRTASYRERMRRAVSMGLTISTVADILAIDRGAARRICDGELVAVPDEMIEFLDSDASRANFATLDRVARARAEEI